MTQREREEEYDREMRRQTTTTPELPRSDDRERDRDYYDRRAGYLDRDRDSDREPRRDREYPSEGPSRRVSHARPGEDERERREGPPAEEWDRRGSRALSDTMPRTNEDGREDSQGKDKSRSWFSSR